MKKTEKKSRLRVLERCLIPLFVGLHISQLVDAPIHWYLRNFIIIYELVIAFALFEWLGRKDEDRSEEEDEWQRSV